MTDYRLTRLPDTDDGRVNWKWERVEKEHGFPTKLISWDWEWIRKEAAKLNIGESKIYHENV